MVTPRNYAKLCNAGRLTGELITAGILQTPVVGFKMYGVEVDSAPNTTVYVIDTLSAPDGITIDNIVAAHVNTPLIEPPMMNNFVYQGKVFWISGTQIGIGTAAVPSRVRDSTDVFDLSWTGQLVANIAGSGVNGLDTGVPANNTWYAVHVIGDVRMMNPPQTLFSLSPTAPTLPAGFNVFRRVGWARRGGAGIFLKFDQVGNLNTRKYFYDESLATLNVLTNGAAVAFAAVGLGSVVPSTAREVRLIVSFSSPGAGAADAVLLRETGSAVATPVNRLAPGLVLANPLIVGHDMVCSAAQSIDYQVSNALDRVSISVASFVDEI